MSFTTRSRTAQGTTAPRQRAYTGAWTEAALAPRAAAHWATPPSPAVTGRRRGRAAYDASSRRAASRSAARVECARKAAAPAAPATTASPLLSWVHNEFECLFTRSTNLGYWAQQTHLSTERSRQLLKRAVRHRRAVPPVRRVFTFSAHPLQRSVGRRQPKQVGRGQPKRCAQGQRTSWAGLYIEPGLRPSRSSAGPTATDAVSTARSPPG